jgi:hypothetical protein
MCLLKFSSSFFYFFQHMESVRYKMVIESNCIIEFHLNEPRNQSEELAIFQVERDINYI